MRGICKIPVAVLTLWVSFSSLVLAQADDGENARKVAAQVELLGHEDFEVRKQASDDLEAMLEDNQQIAALLKTYNDHEDPEIRARIQDLVNKASLEVLAWIDPAEENKARSLSKGNAKHDVVLKIINQSKQPVKVYHMCSCKHKEEGGGNRKQHVKKLEPGATHTCKDAWEKRYYVITDMDGKALGLYLTGESNARILHRDFPGKE
ncbi:MAG: hypothetical protein ACPHYF_10220 [Akkermansiaceae bacterium]